MSKRSKWSIDFLSFKLFKQAFFILNKRSAKLKAYPFWKIRLYSCLYASSFLGRMPLTSLIKEEHLVKRSLTNFITFISEYFFRSLEEIELFI